MEIHTYSLATLQIPNSLHAELQTLALAENMDVISLLETLVYYAKQQHGLRGEENQDSVALQPARSKSHVLHRVAALATSMGMTDLAEQHDHYLYGMEKA